MRYERSRAISARHAELIQLVQGGDHSSATLATELGVSEPTIYRDIEFLREQGIVIKAVRVGRRWAYRVLDATAADRAIQQKRLGAAG